MSNGVSVAERIGAIAAALQTLPRSAATSAVAIAPPGEPTRAAGELPRAVAASSAALAIALAGLGRRDGNEVQRNDTILQETRRQIAWVQGLYGLNSGGDP